MILWYYIDNIKIEGDFMYVSELKAAKAVCINSNMSAVKAYQMVQNSDYSKFPVTDKEGRLVGLITKDDLEDLSDSSSPFKELRMPSILSGTKVRDIMNNNVYYTKETDTIWKAALTMKDHRVSILPVVDDDNKVISVLARNDLFKALLNFTGAKNSGLHISVESRNKDDIFRVAEIVKDAGGVLNFISFYDGRIELKITGPKAASSAEEIDKAGFKIIYSVSATN